MKEYRDRYLGFTYNGKAMNMTAEADFFGFIENSGNELSFFNTPDFSNEFVVPQFGERTFYTGNTKSNRTFSLKIQLDKISLNHYREFLEWLNPDSKGTLIFDYNPNYGYDVKVQSISPSEFHVTKRKNHNEDFYYVDMAVDFVTTEDYAAKWVKPGVFFPGGDLVESEMFEDFIEEIDTDTYRIYNYHNVKNYIIIEFDNFLRIRDGQKSTRYIVHVSDAGTKAKYYSEFGIVLDSNGNFITSDIFSSVFSSSKHTFGGALPQTKSFAISPALTKNFPFVRIRATNSSGMWFEGNITVSSSESITILVDTISSDAEGTHTGWTLEIVDDIPGKKPIIAIEPKSSKDLIITGTNIKIIPTSREIL